jgi:uncharacterized membrane protein YcaP (DUF421 family)
MWQLGVPPLELVARTIIVYVVFFGALRLSGKRELGQFTLFDLALVLLAANAVQPAVTGPDSSVPGGMIILATIFTLNRGLAELRTRVPFLRRVLEFDATVVGRDGRWLTKVMEHEGLDMDDVEAALREHGLESVDEVRLATLEEDGSISIVPIDQSTEARARHRRRYRRNRP